MAASSNLPTVGYKDSEHRNCVKSGEYKGALYVFRMPSFYYIIGLGSIKCLTLCCPNSRVLLWYISQMLPGWWKTVGLRKSSFLSLQIWPRQHGSAREAPGPRSCQIRNTTRLGWTVMQRYGPCANNRFQNNAYINYTTTMPFNRAKVDKDLVRKTRYRVPPNHIAKKGSPKPLVLLI